MPIRSFTFGKRRLAEALGTRARVALGAELAGRVVAAADPLPTLVVSSAPEVRAWATHLDIPVIDDPGSLDLAAEAGAAWHLARGARRVVVVHADLPLAQSGSLRRFATDGARPIVTLVPSHRDEGSPVFSVPLPLPAGLQFAYGVGSFRRHLRNARAAGLAVRVVRDPTLAFDLDVADDLRALTLAAPGRHAFGPTVSIR